MTLAEELRNNDSVNHPSHYTATSMETIDIIKNSLSPVAFEGFLVGNILKYIGRYKLKNGKEDLEKARFYLNKLIDQNE